MTDSQTYPQRLPPPGPAAEVAAIDATRDWLLRAVIGLNLCPFAKAVHVRGQVRYVVSQASDVDGLLADLERELRLLADSDPEVVETTLLIHPWALADFLDYNDFLDIADAAVEALELDGELQVASFHPQYRFADSQPDDIDNCSNRSPWPTLHLLREASVERAVAAFPDAGQIFEANIATLRKLGHAGWDALWDNSRPEPG
jgi:hypothetical protein